MTTIADVLGYRPAPIDLGPFREGTVWHYQGTPYYVETMDLSTGASLARVLGEGRAGLYERSPASLRLRLEILVGYGVLPIERTFDDWVTTPHVRVNGQAWVVNRADGAFSGGTVPYGWEFRLDRAAWQDEQR